MRERKEKGKIKGREGKKGTFPLLGGEGRKGWEKE